MQIAASLFCLIWIDSIGRRWMRILRMQDQYEMKGKGKEIVGSLVEQEEQNAAVGKMQAELLSASGKDGSGFLRNFEPKEIVSPVPKCDLAPLRPKVEREGLSEKAVTAAAEKVAEIIGKKGDFGNAFHREEIEKVLTDAQSRGSLDDVLKQLNVAMKRQNPDLTLSWNSKSTETKLGVDTSTEINLINGKTGKAEDRLRISSSEGHLRLFDCYKEERAPSLKPWLLQGGGRSILDGIEDSGSRK